MKCSLNRNRIQLFGLHCILFSFLLSNFACQKTEEEEAADAATSSTGTSTTTDGTEIVPTNVSNLAALPDIGSLFQSSTSSSLRLAVSGTPPVFSEIKPSTLETYLSPNITTLISNITGYVSASDWDAVDTEVSSFRGAQSKCEAMQSVARQVTDLMQSTGSLCYMGNIGKSSEQILSYISGEEVAQDAFFAQGAEDKVRQLQIGGPEAQNIFFSIPGTNSNSDSYEIKLTFCDVNTNTSNSIDHILVDNAAGKFTYTTASNRDEGENGNFKWHAVISAALKETSAGDGFEFNQSSARTMESKMSSSGSWGSHASNSIMTIAGGVINSHEIGTHSNTFDGSTFSGSSKNILSANFSGTGANDIRIFEGAGKRIGSWSDGSETNAHTDVTGFEFNESATPQYATVTSSTYLDTVNAVDLTTGLLSKDAPEDPDVSAIDSTICSSTPDSIYSLDMQSSGMVAVEAACRNEYDNGRICDALRQQEHQIWDAVHTRENHQ